MTSDNEPKKPNSVRPTPFKLNTEEGAVPDFDKLKELAEGIDVSNQVDTGFDQAEKDRKNIKSIPLPDRPTPPKKTEPKPPVSSEEKPKVKSEVKADKKKLAAEVKQGKSFVTEITNPVNAEILWDEPIFSGQHKIPDISTDVLPDVFQEFADYLSKATQTPPIVSVLLGIAIQGMCHQQKAIVRPKNNSYFEPPQAWTKSVLPPGSRKSAVFDSWLAPVIEWEKEQAILLKKTICKNNITRESIDKQIARLYKDLNKKGSTGEGKLKIQGEILELELTKPEEMFFPQMFDDDSTPEAAQDRLQEQGGGISFFSDEGGGILDNAGGRYNGGMTNCDVLTKGHSGGTVRVKRGDRTVSVDKAAISMGFVVQPSVLEDLGRGSKKSFVGKGLIARFFIGVPKSNVGTRNFDDDSDVPKDIRAAYHILVKKMLDNSVVRDESGNPIPKELKFSPEARQIYSKFGNLMEKRVGDYGPYRTIVEWVGKLPGQACRIAMNRHLTQAAKNNIAVQDGDEVLPGDVLKATDFCYNMIPHTLLAHDVLGIDDEQNNVKKIEKWIMDKKQRDFSARDCFVDLRCVSIPKMETLNIALKIIETNHLVLGYKIGKTKPSARYKVNPKIKFDNNEDL